MGKRKVSEDKIRMMEELRRKKGLSYRKIGEELGVSDSTVRYYLTCERRGGSSAYEADGEEVGIELDANARWEDIVSLFPPGTRYSEILESLGKLVRKNRLKLKD